MIGCRVDLGFHKPLAAPATTAGAANTGAATLGGLTTVARAPLVLSEREGLSRTLFGYRVERMTLSSSREVGEGVGEDEDTGEDADSRALPSPVPVRVPREDRLRGEDMGGVMWLKTVSMARSCSSRSCSSFCARVTRSLVVARKSFSTSLSSESQPPGELVVLGDAYLATLACVKPPPGGRSPSQALIADLALAALTAVSQ